MEQKTKNFLLLHSVAESYTTKYKKKTDEGKPKSAFEEILTLTEEHEVGK